MKKIGILTSGGDCGGLNAVVKGAALMALHEGIQPFVIPNGYAGLYNLLEFDELVELTPSRVDGVNANLAGSEAGHSRVKIRKIKNPKKYERIKEGLAKFGIEGLVISGGDDSGSVMVDLSENGIQCVHAPKTMDFDLQTYSVGFDSTVNRIASFAEEIKTTGRTHNRVIVMDVFGRYSGHTAFRAGVAAEADCILIPEVPADFDIVYEDCKRRYFERVENSDVKSGIYLIIVAEGLRDASGNELVDESSPTDAFGHKRLAGAGTYVRSQITKRFDEDPEIIELMKREKMYVEGLYEAPEVRTVSPGHLVRCGHSSVYDVNFGKEAGGSAVILLKNGVSGVSIVGVQNGIIKYEETAKVIEPRPVDPAIVAFYENLGICFGRKSKNVKLKFEQHQGAIDRFL